MKATTSKFIREYGATLQVLSKRLKYSPATLWRMHKRKELKRFIYETLSASK